MKNDVISEAIVTRTVTPQKEEELNVVLGERIDILGVSENLSDYWKARNQVNATGIVSKESVTVFARGKFVINKDNLGS